MIVHNALSNRSSLLSKYYLIISKLPIRASYQWTNYNLRKLYFSTLSTVDPNSDKCKPPPPKCDPNSYLYTIDGSCNNLKNPQWGQAQTLFPTMLPQNYSDSKLYLAFYLRISNYLYRDFQDERYVWNIVCTMQYKIYNDLDLHLL